jgi:hypothetical protein
MYIHFHNKKTREKTKQRCVRKQRRTCSIFENLIQGSEFGTKHNEIRQPNRFEVVG